MKILMVCLGNICRSPIAHGIMESLIAKEGLDWTVDSAGTGHWHIGQAPDPRAIAIAKHNGVDISRQRAQQFHPDHFARYDRILVMDDQNRVDVLAQTDNVDEKDKVQLFLEDQPVPDPYWDNALFESVYAMIKVRCKYWIDVWRQPQK